MNGMRLPIFVRALTDAARPALEHGLQVSDAFALRRGQIVLARARRQRVPQIADALDGYEQREETTMPDESRWIEPYSPAWFHQFARQYPREAQRVGDLLQFAGTTSCCCFCGDYWRIADYWLLGEQGEWQSLRLCDQCRDEQSRRGQKLIAHTAAP